MIRELDMTKIWKNCLGASILLFPCTYAAASIGKRQSSFITTNYNFEGCYRYFTITPPLYIPVTFNDPSLDLDKCAIACDAFEFFGISQGTDCACGNFIFPLSTLTPAACTSFCSGLGVFTPSQMCGASLYMSIFRKKITGINIPLPEPHRQNYDVGCFSPTAGLSEYLITGALTVERCQLICKGYKFYGLSNQACGCYNIISFSQVSSALCNIPCSGSGSENCGGASARKVYTTQTSCADIDQQFKIKNSGFENGKGYWDALITGQISWAARTDASVAHEGSRYARLDSKSAAAYMILVQYVSVCPGIEYEISWFGMEGSGSACKTWPAVNRASRLALFNDGPTWTEHTATFFAEEEEVEFSIIVQCEGVGSGGFRKLYLDSVKLARIDTAITVTPT